MRPAGGVRWRRVGQRRKPGPGACSSAAPQSSSLARSLARSRAHAPPPPARASRPARTLEVAHGLDAQLERGVVVAHNHGALVQLQRADGPHVAHALLDALGQRVGLVRARDDDDHLARVHDRADADRQRHLRHGALVAAEEARVGLDRVEGQRLDARAAREARAGLVEGDVAVGPDAAEEELDAAVLRDLCLVLVALLLQVRGAAVEDVYVARVNVHMPKKVVPHVAVVRLRVVAREANVLVLRGVGRGERERERKRRARHKHVSAGGFRRQLGACGRVSSRRRRRRRWRRRVPCRW